MVGIRFWIMKIPFGMATCLSLAYLVRSRCRDLIVLVKLEHFRTKSNTYANAIRGTTHPSVLSMTSFVCLCKTIFLSVRWLIYLHLVLSFSLSPHESPPSLSFTLLVYVPLSLHGSTLSFSLSLLLSLFLSLSFTLLVYVSLSPSFCLSLPGTHKRKSNDINKHYPPLSHSIIHFPFRT